MGIDDEHPQSRDTPLKKAKDRLGVTDFRLVEQSINLGELREHGVCEDLAPDIPVRIDPLGVPIQSLLESPETWQCRGGGLLGVVNGHGDDVLDVMAGRSVKDSSHLDEEGTLERKENVLPCPF